MNLLKENYLQGLNEAQKQAVLHREGPLLVVAGAGTGKTRVITCRVAALIDAGVFAEQILAITFTNKAAREMRERVESLIGKNGVTLSTYHSFCARFLRRFSEKVGFTSDYTIYDRDECVSLGNQILKAGNRDKESLTASQLLDRLSSWKQDGLLPAQAIDRAQGSRDREIASFYKTYDFRLRQSNAMDFDDLLLKTVQLLRKDESVRQWAQSQYRYLLIDEYQDTNRIQYEIVRLLGVHGNVCATGDPDQSIYAWRGADIRNILDFETDFPQAKVILLEENYRSTGCILKAASGVIKNNIQRKQRDLWTHQEDGDPLKLVILDDERQEAREVAQRIAQAYQQERLWQQNAVFYRTNAQTRVLERSFRERGIPYRLVGAVSFFKRREVKDLIAYLTLRVNPQDDQAFMRVINTPKRGLGKTSLERLSQFAQSQSLSLFEVLNHLGQIEGLTRRAIGSLQSFAHIFKEIKEEDPRGVRDILMRFIELTDFESSFDSEPDRVERLENIKELVTAAREFDLNQDESSLSEFLAEVSLMSSTELEQGDLAGVTLMTLHSAKGLEFDHVYFLGLEEELMPHVRSLSDPEAIEEERRLMYVGITRARKSLTLLHANTRSQWGQMRWTRPSRFLSEIPEAILEVDDQSSGSQFAEVSYDAEFSNSSQSAWGDEFNQDVIELPVKIGDRVRHARFGTGQILTVSGRPPAVKVRVKFLSMGVRQLIWDKAPLEKI